MVLGSGGRNRSRAHDKVFLAVLTGTRRDLCKSTNSICVNFVVFLTKAGRVRFVGSKQRRGTQETLTANY